MSNAGKADLLLFLVTLLAAISWMFSREAVLLMPPLMFMALRFSLAALLLAAVGYRQLLRLSLRQLLEGLRVGVVFGAGMSCWIMGLHFGTHVGEGAFLTSLGVVLVPVIARIVFAERAPPATWLALPIAALGLGLLALKNGFQPEPGQLFYVAAAVIFALYFSLNTRAANHRLVSGVNGSMIRRERVPALALTSVVLITVALVTGTLSLILEPWDRTLGNFTAIMAGWVAVSALVGTAARFFLQTYAQSLSANSHGVVIMIVEPVWTALIAAAWFGETMGSMQLAGCFLIFMALIANRWPGMRRILHRRG